MSEMNWPTVTVRPARKEDLPILQKRLAEQGDFYEYQDLAKTICYIAEYDGQIVGFCAARPTMQIEPLLLTPDFTKNAPRFSQAKATTLLIRAVDGWIADRTLNKSGLHSYFCSIRGRVMQRLALSFGMIHIYKKCNFYGRDT